METSQKIELYDTLLPFAGVIFLIALGVVLLYLQFQKRIYTEQLKQESLKNNHQKELLRTSIEVQENERKRIAQDLHDELGAILSIGQMQLAQLSKSTSQENDNKKIQHIRDLMQQAIASTRRISHELMPAQLSTIGCKASIQDLIFKAKSAQSIEVYCLIEDNIELVSWEIKVGLYRIFHELINNTLKHAEASSISIEISLKNNKIQCQYSDNGIGISNTKSSTDGMGLKGIEGRVNSLGGTVVMEKSSKKGFKIEFQISTQNQKIMPE